MRNSSTACDCYRFDRLFLRAEEFKKRSDALRVGGKRYAVSRLQSGRSRRYQNAVFAFDKAYENADLVFVVDLKQGSIDQCAFGRDRIFDHFKQTV